MTFRSFLRAAFLLLALGATALAQPASTDPSNPTPWTGFGINSRGWDRDVVYYYSVPSSPGSLRVNMWLDGGGAPGQGMEVSLQRPGGGSLGSTRLTTPGTQAQAFSVPRRERLLMAVRVGANAGNYSLWLNLPEAQPVHIPRPEENVNVAALQNASANIYAAPPEPVPAPSTWSESGTGDPTATTYRDYNVTVYPGEFTLAVTSQARVFSTSVSVDLLDDRGVVVQRVGSISTSGAPVTDTRSFRFTERRNLRVRVSIDANTRNYSWTLTGPMER